MAFKMTLAEQDRLTGYAAELTEKRCKLEDELNVFNEATAALLEGLNRTVAEYNEALEVARGYVEDIHRDKEAEYDEKSERWQESDTGENVRTWLTELENHNLSDLEPYFAETLELPTDEHAEMLNELPREPE